MSAINVNEKFEYIDKRPLDSKNRVSLSRKLLKFLMAIVKFDDFSIYLGEEGDILLRPSVTVPSKEAWLYKNPKALNLVRQGLKEAKEGKIEEAENLNEFLENL